nr:MAG TPA: hypothetical protein [Caudoviricetes sp.]
MLYIQIKEPLYVINFFNHFNSFVINNLNKDILMGISAILVSLLLPLAIFLVEDARSANFVFERAVIFNRVIKPKKLGASIACLTFPLLFPNNFALPFYILGLILYWKVIARILKWMNLKGSAKAEIDSQDSYRNNERIDYLNDTDSFDEAIVIWEYLWKKRENRKDFNERMLVENFIAFYTRYYVESEKVSGNPKIDYGIHQIQEKERMDEVLSEMIKSPYSFKYTFDKAMSKIMIDGSLKIDKESYFFILKKCLERMIEIQMLGDERSLEKTMSLIIASLMDKINGLNEEEKYLFIGKFVDELSNVDLEKCLEISKEYHENLAGLSNLVKFSTEHFKYKDDDELREIGKKSDLSKEISNLLSKYPELNSFLNS